MRGDSNEHPAEAILMSTHNICFYGELYKIILSRIISKYPPYLFHSTLPLTIVFLSMNMRVWMGGGGGGGGVRNSLISKNLAHYSLALKFLHIL